MIEFKLFVSQEEVELNQNSKIQLSKTLIGLEDISIRGLKLTNNFTVPFTNKNDRLLGFPSRLDTNNQAFEQNQKYILTTSIGIISEGNVVIKEFDKYSGIKIQLIEGHDFWTNAGKKLLNDLVLDDHDFIFNDTNMNALKTKGSSVFLTALHSATNGGNTALTNYTYTRPCYYFNNILSEIVSQLGYSLDLTDVESLTTIDSIGCLSNANGFFVSDFKRRFENIQVSGNLDISSGANIFTLAGNTTLSGIDTLTNVLYKTSYVIKGTITSEIDTELIFTFNGNIERILVNRGTNFINFRSDEVEIGSTLVISSIGPVTFDDAYVYSAINESDIFDITGIINISGYLVLADYNLPQQTCKTFIKNLFKLFFMNSSVDESRKEVKFNYLPALLSKNNSLFFSDKVDIHFSVSNGSTYGQLNIMSYQNDTDISNNLGVTFFSVRNENSEPVKDFIRIDEFSASNEVSESGNNIISVPIYDVLENKRQSIKDRIVFFQDTGTFGFNAVFNLISMQRVLSDSYIGFINSTKTERIAELTAHINSLTFKSLENTPIIYVDFLRSHFLVTEVSGFDKINPCKLKVIKFA